MEMPFRMRLPIRGAVGEIPSNTETKSRRRCRSASSSAAEYLPADSRSCPDNSSIDATVPLAQQQRLKRPHRPERHHHGKRIVFTDDAFLPFQLRSPDSRTAGRISFPRDTLETFPVPSPEYWVSWHSPRSGNADAGCSPPSVRRDSQISEHASTQPVCSSSRNCSTHTSITSRISGKVIRGIVKSCRGEETHHPANSGLSLRHQQTCLIFTLFRNVWQQRRVIIVENEGACIFWIARPAGSFISRAQVTRRIVGQLICRSHCFNFALPRSLRPMRRNLNPLAHQWIIATVRFLPLACGAHGVLTWQPRRRIRADAAAASPMLF